MAKFSADKSTVTVERGDCLWNIAKAAWGNGAKYTQIAKLNNISGPKYYIYPGQVLKLTGTASSSSSASSSTSNTLKAKITAFGLIASSTDTDTLFAVWSWNDPGKTEKYEYEWEYTIKDTGNGVWWTGQKQSTNDLECTFNIPDNAEIVRFRVKPISKTYQVTEGSGNNKKTVDKVHFTADWTNFNGDGAYKPYNTNAIPPSPPDAPSVKLDENDKFKLIAELNGIDASELDATGVKFQVVKNNTSIHATTEKAIPINTNLKYVAYECSKLPAGAEYKVRCKSVRGNLESAWSEFSSTTVSTAPSKPAAFTTCKAGQKPNSDEKISVYLGWKAVPSATSYEIEYATDRKYFGTDQTTSISSITDTFYETYSLDMGHTYFFRYRAKNSGGDSAWSDISDGLVLGTPPVPPTTWSSRTTSATYEPLNLYWVHNASDGSRETRAQLTLEVYVANVLKWNTTITIENTNTKDETSSFDATAYLVTNAATYYDEGIQLRWRVRTAGVTREWNTDPDQNYGWSTMRTVDIYAKPDLTLDVRDANNDALGVTNALKSFPLYVSTISTPGTQHPIGFYLSIISNDAYETIDHVGNNKMVNIGETIYSNYIDQNTDLSKVKLSAGDVDFESGVSYTMVCTVAMDSGLTAEDSVKFTVTWDEVSYKPNASIAYDNSLLVTHIHPYCSITNISYQGVTYDPKTDVYTSTGVETAVVGAEPLRRMYMADGTELFSEYVEGGNTIYYYNNRYGRRVTVDSSAIARQEYAYTENGNRVCSGSTAMTIDADGNVTGGEDILVCEVETSTPVEGVLLSVYRREFDGTYTEIAKGIDNSKNIYVTDPHPALDYARYRIVAETQSTGAISYYDMPGYPIGEKAIIIQWSEDWTNFDAADDSLPAQSPWSGSMLRLPYNIDVSDNYGMDVSLVEYIGRKRPVSYYGTQLGETATWNTEIPKDDEETLYAIRRLAIWTGDAYVREPSGSGYWANISVSFSQKHRGMTIPVTFNIKRVEGGA